VDGLSFWLLGTFQIWRGQTRLDETLPGKRRRLLALFLTQPGQFVASDRLVESLWSHLDPAAAANDLQVTVRQLRLWLEPELVRARDSRCLLTEPGGYRFDFGNAALDVDEFGRAHQRGQRALAAHDLPAAQSAFEQARRLYRGDLLIEFPFDEWALLPRERLREQYLYLLDGLATVYHRQGQPAPALEVSQHALSLDPLREVFYRHRLRAHAMLGDRAQVAAVYAECEARLRAELEVEPAAETHALYQSLIQADGVKAEAAPSQAPISLPFVGRAAPLAALHAAWDAPESVALIVGEAGLGKTRLLHEFAATRPGPVLWSRARAADLPLAVVLQWVEAYLALVPSTAELGAALGPLVYPLARLVPRLRDLAPAGPPPAGLERDHLHQAVLAVLRLAARLPLTLLLDDFQWAGGESLSILHDLLLDPLPGLRVLLACRRDALAITHPVGEWLARLRAQRALTEIELARLTEADVLAAVRALTGLPNALALARALHQATGGDPLFVQAVLGGLIDAGHLYRDPGGQWHLPGAVDPAVLPLSHTLRDALLSRTIGLTPRERETLDAAAVLRTNVRAEVLARMLRAPEPAVEAALHAFAQRGFLTANGAAWEFAHVLIGDALYDANLHLPLMHRLAAQALVALTPHAVSVEALAICDHLQRGGDDPSLAAWAVRAGQWAYQSFAPAASLDCFTVALQAVEHAPVSDRASLRGAALEGLALAQRVLGHPGRAVEHVEQALAAGPPARDRLRLLFLQVDLLCQDLGRYPAALELLAAIEASLPPEDQILVQLQLHRAEVFARMGRFADGEAIARAVLAGNSDPSVALWAERVLRENLKGQGRATAELVVHGPHHYAQAQAAGDLRGQAVAAQELIHHHYVLGRLHEALSHAEPARALHQRLDERLGLARLETSIGMVLFSLGELARAQNTLRGAANLAEDVGDTFELSTALGWYGLTLALRGHWSPATAAFDQALRLAREIQSVQREEHLLVKAAYAHWLRGQRQPALAAVQTALRLTAFTRSGYGSRECRFLLGALCVEGGDIAEAETYAAEAHALSQLSRQPLALARAERLLGMVAAARRLPVEALARLAESERLQVAAGAIIELGHTRLVQAETCLSLAGPSPAVHDWLVDARRLFRRAGARPWLKRAEGLLQAHFD
jgi:DNA-binding SARP family transcriptional activator